MRLIVCLLIVFAGQAFGHLGFKREREALKVAHAKGEPYHLKPGFKFASSAIKARNDEFLRQRMTQRETSAVPERMVPLSPTSSPEQKAAVPNSTSIAQKQGQEEVWQEVWRQNWKPVIEELEEKQVKHSENAHKEAGSLVASGSGQNNSRKDAQNSEDLTHRKIEDKASRSPTRSGHSRSSDASPQSTVTPGTQGWKSPPPGSSLPLATSTPHNNRNLGGAENTGRVSLEALGASEKPKPVDLENGETIEVNSVWPSGGTTRASKALDQSGDRGRVVPDFW